MILTPNQSTVLESLRTSTKTVVQVSSETKLTEHLVTVSIHQLIAMNALRKLGRGKYEVIIEAYYVSDGKVDAQENQEPSLNLDTSAVGVNVREKIQKLLGQKQPRTAIARNLGIPKVLLNQVIFEMGNAK